jgi:fumarate hydratase subunit beta
MSAATQAPRRLRAPLDDDAVLSCRVGDAVLLDGVLYGARDAAHARLIATLEAGETLPFDPRGQIIYDVGPAPAPPGQPIGSAGPTTSGRMDRYAPALYAAGLRATVGKGFRSPEVRAAIVEQRGLYLAALGGSGALLSRCIVAAEVIAYPELGPEAIYRFDVRDFPAVVANDAYGGDVYVDAKAQYRLDS